MHSYFNTNINTLPTKLIYCFGVAIIVVGLQQVAQSHDDVTFIGAIVDSRQGLDLECDTSIEVDQLGDDCNMLKFFNRTLLESMNKTDSEPMLEKCACQLALMRPLWQQSFDDEQQVALYLYSNVTHVLDRYENEVRINRNNAEKMLNLVYPKYLWSDVDIYVEGISVYTSTKDYFDKRRTDPSLHLSKETRSKLSKDESFLAIQSFCNDIRRDQYKLYRYMENLIRAEPRIFVRLLATSEYVNFVYQTSKACKFLLLKHLDKYKLRPSNSDFIPVDDITDLPMTKSIPAIDIQTINNNDDHDILLNDSGDAQEETNSIRQDEDTEHMFKDASALLTDCSIWQTRRRSVQELLHECPMMMMNANKVPKAWIEKHPTKADQSKVAVRCGCQLLLHNSTWNEMMKDSNIKVMSQAITNYMLQNRLSQFMDAPVYAIYGWFNEIMDKFKDNRKLAIKEIVKTLRQSQDPPEMINHVTGDAANALELLRRGCNYVMLNYNKGSNAKSEIKLITYLDNLQLISQDPMFVFHLTLQDANLFKIHAISKMCIPIVY